MVVIQLWWCLDFLITKFIKRCYTFGLLEVPVWFSSSSSTNRFSTGKCSWSSTCIQRSIGKVFIDCALDSYWPSKLSIADIMPNTCSFLSEIRKGYTFSPKVKLVLMKHCYKLSHWLLCYERCLGRGDINILYHCISRYWAPPYPS